MRTSAPMQPVGGPRKIRAIVINLKARQDRWSTIQTKFEGTCILLERFEAIKHHAGWVGCAKSHIAAVNFAQQMGLQWVLVLEDDAEPVFLPGETPEMWSLRFWQILDAALPKRAEWDVLLGGATFVVPRVGKSKMLTSAPPIARLKRASCAHFLIYNATAYPLINSWKKSRRPIDVHIADTCRIVVAHPFLAVQSATFSDIEQRMVNYRDLFAAGAKEVARQVASANVRAGGIL
jgi:hypothetical protein